MQLIEAFLRVKLRLTSNHFRHQGSHFLRMEPMEECVTTKEQALEPHSQRSVLTEAIAAETAVVEVVAVI